MLGVTKYFKNYQFTICAAPSKNKSFYEKFIQTGNYENVDIVNDKTYNILERSSAALVTSGTATLEAALIKTPQIVCYKSSWISIIIGKFLLRNLKFISLVNLILDKMAVKELIQDDLNTKNMIEELEIILSKDGKDKLIGYYNELESLLNKKGASRETAKKIINYHLDSNS